MTALPDARPAPSGAVPTLRGVEAAIRAAWSFETCDTDDQPLWSPDNPARGQCRVTSVVVAELFGGVLLEAHAYRDGGQVGFHYWNRLPSGLDLDLTREQFGPDEQVGEPREVQPQPPAASHRAAYELLAGRVRATLGDAGSAIGRLVSPPTIRP